jgi:hypothetical protein
MGTTTFSGPVVSDNGFVGTITGNITGDVTGNVTGNLNGTVGATTPAAGTFTDLTSTGNTSLGNAGTDLVGFYGATPVAQPTTAITAAAFLAGTSGIADDTATFGGYTIGQVVAALKDLGLLD